jgi:4-hydroxy-2-oxoglutarate aldolase
MTPDALIAHFRAVADDSPVPVVLYNLPGPTGIVLTVPIVAALADHANVAGMKETSPELERLGQCVTLRNGTFPVFSGWAPVVYPAVVAGAAGGILAVANVLPNECVSLVEHARAGRHSEALSLQRRITHLAQLVSSVHGVPGLKKAMDMFGFNGGPVRGPLQPLAGRACDDLARAVSSFQS